jgi:alpha-tubulin suppressor-like RCC1 family protein
MTTRRIASLLSVGFLLFILTGCSDSSGPGDSSQLLAVSGGDDHACLVLRTGAAHCWGWGALGQLGPGDTLDYNVPVKVTGDVKFSQISAGSAHTCALTQNGVAHCWGGNAVGALGDPSAVFKSKTPIEVTGGFRFLNISAGTGYTCGVALSKLGYCWGSGLNGELGNGLEEDQFTPVPVSGGHQFQRISTSLFHTCGLTTDGAIYCWGDNLYGKLGNGTLNHSTTPVLVTGGRTYKAIGTGDFFSCALSQQGRAFCWGSNVSFELGNGVPGVTYVTEPTTVFGNHTFTAIAVGSYHACGLTSDGSLVCWGANTYGKLGNGLEQATVVPVQVTGGHEFTAVTAGGNHTCALTENEGAFCWGWNRLGQLGIGSRRTMFQPSQVTESYLE